MPTMRNILLTIAMLCAALGAAQPRSAAKDSTGQGPQLVAIHAIARQFGDSIIVRWGPEGAIVWMLTRREGFILKRRAYRKGEHNMYTLVDSTTLHIAPWPLEKFASHFEATHDSVSLMAAQVIYGKSAAPFNNGSGGNSMQMILDKYNEQQGLLGFALMAADFDPAAAEGLGMRYVDRDISPGLHYLYTIHPAAPQAIALADTGMVMVDGNQVYHRRTFPTPTAVAGDRVVHLFWPTMDTTMMGYTGYRIERSEDGKQFTPLTRRPFIPTQNEPGKLNKPARFDDSVSVNYKRYWYRVSGIDPFSLWSQPSEAVSVMAVDLTPPIAPMITDIKPTGDGRQIHLHWEKPLMENDFKGWVVGRSTSMNGPFEPLNKELLPAGTHDLTDEHPSGNAPNFYVVAAVDTAMNAGRSTPSYMNIDDHEPPTRPEGLAGTIDSVGKVSLHWRWNRDPDLAGYRIFFSNSAKDVFTPAAGYMLTDTLFADSTTLHTLTKHLFYRVIAYDRNMNASEPSEILRLERPDTIAPMAAIIHDFSVTDTAVTLRWYMSASEDVAGQKLFRTTDTTGTWTLLADLPPTDTVYADKSVEAGRRYAYAIEARDSSGHSSGRSFPLQVYVYKFAEVGGIQSLSVKQDGGKAVLTWRMPDEPVEFYVLYKAKGDAGLRLAGNIPGNLATYEDQVPYGKYRYAIKAVYKDGGASVMSAVQTVQVQ